VSEDIEKMSFNTAISALMILTNEMDKRETIPHAYYKHLLHLLAPFVPHITEEIWENIGGKSSIHLDKWPTFDATKIVLQNTKIAIQVNGKVRAEMELEVEMSEEMIKEKALSLQAIETWIKGKNPKKTIYVKDKLINIVVDNV
jgi:leucyl-tRNA synthetase